MVLCMLIRNEARELARRYRASWLCVFFCSILLGVACGSFQAKDILGEASAEDQKTPCSNNSSSFEICLSQATELPDPAFAQRVYRAVGVLNSLVNSRLFQKSLRTAFVQGDELVGHLLATNYIVTVKSYCIPESDVLGRATLGGFVVHLNRCALRRDAAQGYDLAQVSGVLLHEVMHNLGYTHADQNPSPNSVPYFIGNLAERMIRERGVK